MKRFLIFVIPQYYPAGGMNDLHDQADTLEDAVSIADKKSAERKDFYMWNSIEIYDTLKQKEVWSK
jgi:hypothetical protein